MKHLFEKLNWFVAIAALLLSLEGFAQGQSEGVGINTTTIDPRSVLHIENTYDDNNLPKGIKLPSYDASEIADLELFGQAGNTLNRGLLLFSNENNQIYQVAEYDLTPFIEPIGWGMHGNDLSNLTYGSYFLGTTDPSRFSLGTDDTKLMTFMETGEIVIGSSQSVASDASFQINGTKGLLLPRLTTSERLNIQSPTPGLFVYDTDDNLLYVGIIDLTGTLAWSEVGGGGGSGSDADWTIGSGVIYNTTDNVGIGISNPTTKLHVFGDIGIGNDGQIISDGFSSGSSPRIAYGFDTDASGGYGAVAIGYRAIASGLVSVALGLNVTASGYASVAMGESNIAGAQNSIAMGESMTLSSAATNSFGISLSGNHSVTTPNVMSVMGGNVGIGSLSPSQKLDVDGNILISAGSAIYSGYNNSYILRDHNNGNVTVNAAGTDLYLGYITTNRIRLYTDLYNADATIKIIDKDGFIYQNSSSVKNYFAGNVGIGVTASSYPLYVLASNTGYLSYFSNTTPTGGTGIRSHVGSTATGTGNRYGMYGTAWYGQSINYGGYFYGYGGTASYGIYAKAGSGTDRYGVYGTASGGYAMYSAGSQASTTSALWTSVSDRKMKNNIQDLNVNAIETIAKFKPKTFTYKFEEYPHMDLPNTQQWGFIAQEVGEVMPEMVRDISHPAMEDEDGKELHPQVGIKGLNLDRLFPLFVKAFQEQQKMIEEQQEELNFLRVEVEQLKRKIK